jgi:hypothetical protein
VTSSAKSAAGVGAASTERVPGGDLVGVHPGRRLDRGPYRFYGEVRGGDLGVCGVVSSVYFYDQLLRRGPGRGPGRRLGVLTAALALALGAAVLGGIGPVEVWQFMIGWR